VTVADDGFAGGELRPASAERLARIAAALASTPGLRVEVEGNCDAPSGDATALARANGVARALQSSGVSGITSRGLGSSHLLTSNASEAGRVMNRRVEIVISGDAIGTLPYWDRTYRIK
jgi:outer membrane protein OmpA-like peptidoglycan-associated protein